MKHLWENFVGLLALLYGLSWLILFAGVVLMCFRPNPSVATTEAIMLTLILAFYYIAAYFMLRGIGRLFSRGSSTVPPPQETVVIRRVILEEVTTPGAGPPEHRVILEEVAPYDERNGHAR